MAQILYVVIQSATKVSILLLYFHIFSGTRFRFWTKAVIGFMACHFLAFLFAVSLQCIPVTAVWNLDIKGKCISSTVIVLAGAVMSITEDLVIILLPIPCLRTLQLSLKKRIELIFLFALGSL
jgi:hypothetical protein